MRNHDRLIALPRLAFAGALCLALGGLAACAEQAAPVAPDLAADLATLTAAAPGGGDAAGVPAGTPGPVDQYATAQATLNAEIADVADLVSRQAPLATFTPAPDEGPALSGRLLYVRSGKFYTVGASGEPIEPLPVPSDLPPVWSPPGDPGRAWSSPDRSRVAFFAGADAEVWIMNTDGTGARQVLAASLPSDEHVLTTADGERQTVRLRPGQDYTIVRTPGGENPFAVLTDDNNRHVKNEGRMRLVHAAPGLAGRTLRPVVNGAEYGEPMTYGRSSGDMRVPAGSVAVDMLDRDTAEVVASFPGLAIDSYELKTVFLTGDTAYEVAEADYEPGSRPPGGSSRLRVFNGSAAPLSVQIDGETVVAAALAGHALGEYVPVAAVADEDRRRDLELDIYGMRPLELPLVWSPDSKSVAFLAAPEGATDIYVAAADGSVSRITEDADRELNPTWSPDSRNLAWISVDDRYDTHRVSVHVGGETRALPLDPILVAHGWAPTSEVRFPGGAFWVDEGRIALYPTAERMSGGIWTVDVASGEATQAYADRIAEPDWSPVAKRWAFGVQAGVGELYVMPLDGQPEKIVATDAHYPRWSPDGAALSYVEGDPKSPEGWRIHVVDPDGENDRTLTERLPLLQSDPSVPGANAKRIWLDGGAQLGFTRAGRDYGRAEAAGPMSSGEAGDDIENLWIVPTDGTGEPRLATDLTQVFYLREIEPSPGGEALAFVAFSYMNRAQQLFAAPAGGGKPVHIDGAVRWYQWLGR